MALSGLLAFGYLLLVTKPPSLLRTLVKTASIGVLAGLAAFTGGPILLVAALTLSALGDAFLAHDGDGPFMAGLGSFLAAHVAYVALFAGLGDSLGGGFSALPVWPAVAMVAFALAVGAALVRRAGALAVPVAVYVCAILSMGLAALTLPLQGWGALVLAGALAFMASDSLLGTEKFLLGAASGLRRFTTPAVWCLYWAGQAAIFLGVIRLALAA